MLRHSTSTRLAKAGLIPCFHVRGAVRFFPRRACRMDQTGNRTSEPETQWVERREKYEVRDLRFKRLLQFGAKAGWHCQPVLLNNWAIASGMPTIQEFGCDDHKRPSRGTITTFISTRLAFAARLPARLVPFESQTQRSRTRSSLR